MSTHSKSNKKIEISEYVIITQSVIAILGSLYYGRYGDPFTQRTTGDFFNSENGLLPCELCWFARICMYPILPITVMGIYRKTKDYIYYILPLAITGIGLEIYHYILQKINIETSFVCTRSKPCNALEVDYFGFITIPLLCLVAFLVILGAIFIINKNSKKK